MSRKHSKSGGPLGVPGIILGSWCPAPAALSEGQRIYGVGDIHGRADLLAALIRFIREDVAASESDLAHKVIFLGDYVDRGPASRKVIELLATLEIPNVEVLCLKGNHEAFMLEFICRPLSGMMWLANGGKATLESYGIVPPQFWDAFDGVSLPRAASGLADALSDAQKRFLLNLLLSHRADGYFFSHAGIRPHVPLARQDEKDLLWIDSMFLMSDADHGAVVVHGHNISEKICIHPNRIGIDTGAYRTGRLTCLVLEGTRLRTATTAPPG